jgi:glutaredoxin
VKEYLHQNGVEFDAKDVTVDPANLQEMLEKTGGLRGVPVILVDNDVIRGFNRDLLKARLGLEA